MGEALTEVALGLSMPAVGNHVALAAPSAINGTLSPRQIAVDEGVTSAATACTTTVMDASPMPQLFSSVTLNVVDPTGGVMFWTGTLMSSMSGCGVQTISEVPLAMSCTSSPSHTGSTGRITGVGGCWMFTSISASTGSKHPAGSVTVKITVYDPGLEKVCVGSYSVLTALSSNVQR